MTDTAFPAPASSGGAPVSHQPAVPAGANRAGAVKAARVRVWEDEHHDLHVSVDGEDMADVRAVRVFPVTRTAPYVSFLNEDDKEVALLADPDKLDKASRKALRKALARMYYVARIKRVFAITEVHGISTWEVMTDRGYASFEVMSRENIRELPDGRYVIVDADGNRFEIPNMEALDHQSRTRVISET